jgi:predicted transcriptional regulator
MFFVANVITQNAVETVVIYAAAAGVGSLLVWIGKSVATVAKKQSVIHDQVMGVPEVGYPSMRDQFTEIRNHLSDQDRTLEKLEHEVQDNSGSSLKDAVRAVNRDLINIKNEITPSIAKNGKSLEALQAKVDSVSNRLDNHITAVEARSH